jgi:hypothetical protein
MLQVKTVLTFLKTFMPFEVGVLLLIYSQQPTVTEHKIFTDYMLIEEE